MEQPKKGTAKKDIANVSVPVELKPVEDVEEEESDGLEEQLRIANVVCDAIDLLVESRSAAIVAIRDGHMASFTAQLQLMVSTFPEHIRKMPMKKFLKQHCPNTRANTRSDGTLCFDLVKDAALTIGGFRTPGGAGSLNFNIGFASVQNTPGYAPSETSMMDIVSPKD